jgi:hypothetical protein
MVVFGHVVENGTKKDMYLIITDSDNKNGIPRDNERCAAALACLRIPHVTRARVTRSRLYLEIDGIRTERYKTPASIKQQLPAYDKIKIFDKGRYDILPLAESEKREDYWKEMKKVELKVTPLSPSRMPDGKRQGGSTKDEFGKEKISKKDGSRRSHRHEISWLRGRAHWTKMES